MENQLLTQQFIDDTCLTMPLPEQWQLLPKTALRHRLWQSGIIGGLAIVITGVMLVISEFELPLIIGFAAAWLFTAILVSTTIAGYHRTRHLLRRHDMLLEHGIVWRHAVMLPLSRLQHVSVSQGPLQKRFGLATLKLFTAGGLDAEASLRDITFADAQHMSEQLSTLIADQTQDPQ